jgi:hypothetical protein
VAIKVLHATLTESPAVRERLRREALTLQRVQMLTTDAIVKPFGSEVPFPRRSWSPTAAESEPNYPSDPSEPSERTHRCDLSADDPKEEQR